MHSIATPAELTGVRRIFEAWSIEIPESFEETFVKDGSYWHAYDEHRSVSLTSILVSDKHGPVGATMIAAQIPPLDGTPVDRLPPGLVGRAVVAAAIKPARASRTLSGMLAAQGRLLVATITSDDIDWARQIWLSIRHHRAELLPRRERRMADRKRRRR